MKNQHLHRLIVIAMIAAVYAAVSLALAPISFGAIQIRVAEALTLLPALSFLGVYGVTLGCFITNLVGVFTGVNILGFWDVLFGTLATLSAALLTYRFRRIRFNGYPLLSAFMPVIFNSLIIGAELTFILAPSFTIGYFTLFAVEVGVGELLSCFILGLPLMKRFEKLNLFKSAE